MPRSSLIRFAWLSIAAAVVTISLKLWAYWITNSVGLLSDALESVVNLVAAIVALAMLTLATRPPDEDHEYGHDKAEYFSSGVEGVLILIAATSIVWAVVARWRDPVPVTFEPVGLVISVVATLINLAVGLVLIRIGRRERAIALTADGQHLMTDVWTTGGVLLGVGLTFITHWQWLDAAVALVVAANIVWQGLVLVRRSALGLMDTALPLEETDAIKAVLDQYCVDGVTYHALRTRQSGIRRFGSVHILVPGQWTVQHGHQLVERIEAAISRALPSTTIVTHLEPVEDPTSFDDVSIDRARIPEQKLDF